MIIDNDIKEYGKVNDISKQLEQVFTVAEIREILKISRAMSYELVKSEAFPIIRIGRTIRIPAKTFHEWLFQRHSVVS